MFKKIALAAVCAALSTAAFAHGFKVGGLEIDHPFAFETPPMAMAGGGFMTIKNTGDSADRLVGVSADFPRVEVHETVVTDGVGQMLPVEGIEIPAGETVTLQPGGYHVMFIGLEGKQFVEGDKIPATLIFENAGEIAVEFAVEKRPSGMGMNMNHGNMDHGKMDHGKMDHGKMDHGNMDHGNMNHGKPAMKGMSAN